MLHRSFRHKKRSRIPINGAQNAFSRQKLIQIINDWLGEVINNTCSEKFPAKQMLQTPISQTAASSSFNIKTTPRSFFPKFSMFLSEELFSKNPCKELLLNHVKTNFIVPVGFSHLIINVKVGWQVIFHSKSKRNCVHFIDLNLGLIA